MADRDVSPGRVVSCGACRFPAGAEGLRCRIGQDLTVEASWDPERDALCCVVPAARCGAPNFAYEVLDAKGNVICKSVSCCSNKPSSACAMRDCRVCDDPEVFGDARAPRDGAGGTSAAAAAAAAAAPAASGGGRSALAGLSWLDRLLPVWIVAAMVLGVVLGYFVPQVRSSLAVLEVGGVSLPIALGLWLMMLPVLTKVRYELLGRLLADRAVAKVFGLSFALNWVLGPLLMTALAWACLPDLPDYRNGVIMVGLARCIAMVLIWNDLAGGHAEFCAVLVAFNSCMQILLYAPLSMLYLNVVSGSSAHARVGFWPVAKSVLLFLGVPLAAGIVLRVALLRLTSREFFERRFLPRFGPLALLGLLYTIVVMFAAQGEAIVSQVASVARVAVPMLAYFLAMFALSIALSYAVRMDYELSAVQAFTASSNNFELAIAVAVGTFGVQSHEALAATVGPLIEVPVLLALVYVALALKPRLWGRPRGPGPKGAKLAALAPAPAPPAKPLAVLFACVHNAGRSQMARALFEQLVDPAWGVAASAGSRPAAAVQPEVVRVMAERGADLSAAAPRLLTPELAAASDVLVTMGCGEACPYAPGLRVVAWDVPDPRGLGEDGARAVRDLLAGRVAALAGELGLPARRGAGAA